MRQSEARKQQNSRIKPERYFDYSLLFIILFLLAFGLIVLYSTSTYNAQLKMGDAAYYFRRQLYSTLVGIVGLIFFTLIDYRVWNRFAVVMYLGAFALCGLVFSPFGVAYNGSRRWVNFGGFQFQPSEVAKIATIVFLAALLSKTPKAMEKIRNIFKIFILVIPMFGIIAYTNLSTGIIIFGIAFVMVFVASPKYKPFFVLAGIAVALGVVFIMAEGYRGDRIDAWLHPEVSDNAYQTLQSLYAIGSGGLFGKGLGESVQKLGYVPEAQNDMIFSIVCEELGLFGAICIILLFVLMIWRFMVIANNAPDLFGAFIVVGIMAQIAIQVVLNIAVVTNTIPNTGVTLPFVSYGGTSVTFLLSEMGLALSVSRGIRIQSEMSEV